MILSAAYLIDSVASLSILRALYSATSFGLMVLARLTFFIFPGVEESGFESRLGASSFLDGCISSF